MKKLIFSLIALFLLAGFVGAAGIVSPYWKDYPLQMNYGETKMVNFNLQNMVGDEDITIEVMIKQGSEIATLEQTTYTAAAGTSDTMIPLRIIVPENYDKQIQTISLEFKSVAPSEQGMVVLGTGWTTSFDVIISQKEVPKSALMNLIIILAIVLLILAIIIFVLVRRRK